MTTGPVRDSETTVGIVILTWNDQADLDRAVASVHTSTGVGFELIVVDNGSTPPAVVDPSRARLLRNEQNRGVAAARNQGASLVRSPYVCFLDSDAILEPDCLHLLLQVLVEHPEVGLAAPVFRGQSSRASAGRAPGFGRKLLRLIGASSLYARCADGGGDWWDVEFAIGACQVIRRSAFAEVGGLDETYFYGPEDIDLCLRLRAKAWRVVQVRDAACRHPARRRFRNPLSRRGAAHAHAVLRHLWRQRR